MMSLRLNCPLPLSNGFDCPSPSFHPIIYISRKVAGIFLSPSSVCKLLYIASFANRTSLEIGPASLRKIALLSPIAWRSDMRAKVSGYSTTISSTSTVSNLNPALVSNPPISRTSASGDT
ncbi:hypothetical protein H106_08939 [Trichophyton rubrum CBS 735.88]|nr:hypothetical protein H106_08939 [Trichophyton rubrum CBS 735.88]